jgi:hypothetical protein
MQLIGCLDKAQEGWRRYSRTAPELGKTYLHAPKILAQCTYSKGAVFLRVQVAERPVPSDCTLPSLLNCSRTSRMVWSLIPGTAVLISRGGTCWARGAGCARRRAAALSPGLRRGRPIGEEGVSMRLALCGRPRFAAGSPEHADRRVRPVSRAPPELGNRLLDWPEYWEPAGVTDLLSWPPRNGLGLALIKGTWAEICQTRAHCAVGVVIL